MYFSELIPIDDALADWEKEYIYKVNVAKRNVMTYFAYF